MALMANSRRHKFSKRTALLTGLSLPVFLGLVFVFGMNIFRLHLNLPVETKHDVRFPHLRRKERRRMEQRDRQQYPLDVTSSVWLHVEEQLLQRQRNCGFSGTHSLGLLTALQQYRNLNGMQQEVTCPLPSPCPISDAETTVALVLVVDDGGDGDDNATMNSLNWRQVVVACFKILPVVDELWILISHKIWTAPSADKLGDDNNNTRKDNQQLYRERVRQWRHQSDARVHPIVVSDNEGDVWMHALRQLNGKTNATAIVWAEWNHMSPNTVWRTFIQRRVEAWRKMPMSLYVSHYLTLSDTAATRHEAGDSVARSDPNCPFADTGGASGNKLNSLPARLVARNLSQPHGPAIPTIHGLVHDRMWLCFWRHPIVHSILRDDTWNALSLVAALWMAHLAGIRHLVVDGEDMDNSIRASTIPLEIVNFFGGSSLPAMSMALSERCSD